MPWSSLCRSLERLGLDRDVHPDQRRAPAELDVGYLTDLDTASENGRTLVEPGDGRLEEQHVVELGPEQAGATPHQERRQQQGDGADDEGADDRRVRAHAHPVDPPATCSPRVRNARTFGSGLSSRSVVGLPSAIMGILPTTPLQVVDFSALALPTALEESVERTIDRALDQRPDLIAKVALVREKEATVRRARADYFPTLSLGADVGGELARFKYELGTVNTNWSNIGQLTYGAG